MISLEAAAQRVDGMVERGQSGRRAARMRGRAIRSVYQPTILTKTAPGMRVLDEEIFGPVLSVIPFDKLDRSYRRCQCDAFRSIRRAFHEGSEQLPSRPHRGCALVSVHINETSSARADAMPFGGVKDSGFGHEGPKYAVREYTEERLITLTP